MSSSTVGSESFGGGTKPAGESARNMTETFRNIHENYRCAYVVDRQGIFQCRTGVAATIGRRPAGYWLLKTRLGWNSPRSIAPMATLLPP
jgi:hypothetical protein